MGTKPHTWWGDTARSGQTHGQDVLSPLLLSLTLDVLASAAGESQK